MKLRKSFIINKLEDIEIVAKAFVDYILNIPDYKCFCFNADLGAGKTTFISAICEELGVEDEVTSPTFAIINEYQTKKYEIIYHFDFYRINSIDEALNIGVEEYFYSNNLCFIEWAENISELLPEKIMLIKIIVENTGARKLEIFF